MTEAIRLREIWRLKNVMNGDKVCIFELPEDLYIINLSFEGGLPILEIQNNCPPEIVKEIYILFNSIIERIKQSEEILITCNYAFGYYNKEIFLISYALNGIPFSYTIILKCGEKIQVPILTPIWIGKLTQMTPYAFLKDILIQKY
jgi:hypothetical protein